MNKYLVLILIVLTAGLSQCGDQKKPHHHKKNTIHDKAQLINEIDSLEAIFEKEGAQNKKLVSELISIYSKYRNLFKEDERAPIYFLKAGNLARSVQNWSKAAEIYKNFFNDYKNHSKREEVLYMLGGIYDFWLHNKKDAKQTYNHYLKIYPEGEFLDEVQKSLELIDVPLEERVKIFQKNNNKE